MFFKFINKYQKEILRCAPPSSHLCDFLYDTLMPNYFVQVNENLKEFSEASTDCKSLFGIAADLISVGNIMLHEKT